MRRARIGRDGVGTKHLDDDGDAVGLIIVALVDPALSAFADELTQVKTNATAPHENVPDQMVAQQGNARVGWMHGPPAYPGCSPKSDRSWKTPDRRARDG